MPPNRFGVYREYTHALRNDPKIGLSPHEFADSPTHVRPPSNRDALRPLGTTLAKCAHMAAGATRNVASQSFAPFLNWSTFKLMEWQYSGSTSKLSGELQRLVDDVLMQEQFNAKELYGFNVKREQRRLDEHQQTGGVPMDGGR